jgi:hypothetical protein
MPKSRIMGAGLAGSTTRNVSTNGCQGGGNKKQGTAFLTGRMDSVWPSADGVARCQEGRYNNKCNRVGSGVVIQTKYQPYTLRSRHVKNYHLRGQYFQ